MSLFCIPTTTRARAWLAALVIALAGGCGASSKEVRAARSSGYQADFALVYSEVLAEVRKLYPQLDENASAGVIKTSWHPLRVSTGREEQRATQRRDTVGLVGGQFVGTPIKQYFIRFTVYVVGGKPWRVRVVGQASQWEAGAVPVEMRGGDEPHWLAGRTQALEVGIYRRLKSHAVKMEAPASEAEVADGPPEITPGLFGDIPDQAAAAVAGVLAAAKARDLVSLGTRMHRDFTWSLGAPPSARDAMLMWQADGTIMAQLIAVLEAGCRAAAAGTAISCPPQAADQAHYQGYRAGFAAQPDGSWKMVHFMSAE